MQRLPGAEFDLQAVVAELAGLEGAVRGGDLACQLLERDAIERQPLRVWFHADFFGLVAGNVGEANIFELRQLDLEFAYHTAQAVGGPVRGGLRLGRQGNDIDRHIVDATPDDERFGNADGYTVDVGTQFLMHSQHGGVRTGANQEACSHHHIVVARL